ncbi:MAG TPA: helix-turn-helix domain-containing protein [bacterium]|nr:helix-turn-helix domain-containing protein [bacterium]
MNVFSIIYLLGAAQGFLLVAVLALRKTNVSSNRILALLLGLFSLNLLNLAAREYMPGNFSLLTAPFSLIYGPLIWLYVSSLTLNIDNKIRRFAILHFVPFFVAIFMYSPFFPLEISKYIMIILGFKIVQYAAYLTASLIVLKRHESFIRDFFSDIGSVTLQWLRIMIIIDFISLSIVSFFMIMHVFDIYDISAGRAVSRVTFIISSLVIYIIGYFSMKQPEIRQIAENRNDETDQPAKTSKYENSRIEDDIIAQYMKELSCYMEKEKPYLNSELTLKDLADSMSLTYHDLSQVLNAGFKQNFYNYINTFRIKEAKDILSDPKRSDNKILSIVYESGFKNKSNFNTFFKKITGMTPSEYRKNAINYKK